MPQTVPSPFTLVARSVSISYGARRILDEVSFEVVQGTSVAIVGPSGAGKTTLLAILARMKSPDSGVVKVESDRLDVTKSAKIAYVPQGANALGLRSAVDNVAVAAKACGMGSVAAEARSVELLNTLGIGDRASIQARRLSGGEVQRVALARAFAAEPAFLFADEPTGQLDHTTTGTTVDRLVDQTVKQQVGLVIVTHDRDVAMRCDRVLNLEGGSLRALNEGP